MSMTWAEFRERYEATVANGGRLTEWRVAAKKLERICGPATVDQITDAMLSRFVIGLRADGLGRESIRGRLTALRAGLKWAFASGILDPSLFDVVPSKREGGGGWRWRSNRKWGDLDTYGDARVA